MSSPAMITAEFEPGSLSKLQLQLAMLGNKAPEALKKAINSTAKTAKADLVNEAQKTYIAYSGAFSGIKIKRASTANLAAYINVTGAPAELYKFKVSPKQYRTARKSSSVSAQVLRQGSPKALEKNGIKAFVAKFKSGHVTVAERQGSSRLPIKTLYSVSAPTMIGNEHRVYGVVEPSIQNNLQKNVEAEVQRVINSI